MDMSAEKTFSVLTWLAIGILLFFISAAAVLKCVDIKIDYHTHIRIAAGITWEGLHHPVAFLKEYCYPMWHILTWLTMNVFCCSGRLAAAVVTGGCIVGTWTCAVWHFSRRCLDDGKGIAWVAGVFLMLAMPIWLPPFNPNIMIGQGGPNLLHNPTNIMVRLLALPCFLWCASIMDGIGKESAFRMGAWKIIALALLVFLSALSKPSFVQMFFPAMFIMAAFKLIKYRKAAIGAIGIVVVSFIPVFFLIALQAWVSFYGGDGAGITIAFLKVWRYYSPNVFVSVMLSVLFPLIVLLWSIRVRAVSTADVLSWIMYGVSVAEFALLCENGPRWWHGNFGWAASLAQFFIWFTAIDRFVSLARGCDNTTIGLERKLWFWCAAVACSLHILSGLCYLWRVLALGVWR